MPTRVLQLPRRGSVRAVQGACIVVLAAGLMGCVREPAETPAARSVEPVAEQPTVAVEPTAPAGDAAMAPAVPAELTTGRDRGCSAPDLGAAWPTSRS